MTNDRHSKKQSFAPYAALIIVAIVLVAVGNAGALYYTYEKQKERDNNLANIESQNQNATLEGVRINSLYHGQIMWLIGNNTKTITSNTEKLNSLIDAHNQLVKAIENATGKPQIINKQTIVHVTHQHFCTINQIYVPKECKHLIK